MGNTNPNAQEVRDALRDYKVDFQTIGPWDTVGSAWNNTGGGLYGCIMHHTGAGVQGYKGAPSLTWMRNPVIDGQPLGKPACNILVGRGKGDTYLISALAVLHSGLGGPWPAIGINSAGYGAESRTFGVEIEGSTAYANIPESRPYFTEYQEENSARIAAALWDLCGWPADGSRIVTHADWTDSGKYLGTNNYGPYLGRKPDTRRSTHSGKYWRKMAAKYLDPSKAGSEPSGNTQNDGGKKGSDNKTDDNVVDLARQVKPNAVAKSVVAGTPQRARFALMNMANESIYLSEGETSVLSGSGEGILWVKARTLIDGESYEVSRKISDKSANGDVTIETNWIQNDTSAEAALSLITDSFDFKFKSVTVQIFGNPLIQLGDLVKLTYKTGKISFDDSKYYIVTKVSQSFDIGLSTTVSLSPVNKFS
jgi:hypothetical protein